MPLHQGGNWQTTLAWGRNQKLPGHKLDAFLLESSVRAFPRHTIFGRFESVEKDELFTKGSSLFNKVFTVNKLNVGYVYDLVVWEHFALGPGFSADVYFLPEELHSFYGQSPFSYMLFIRARTR